MHSNLLDNYPKEARYVLAPESENDSKLDQSKPARASKKEHGHTSKGSKSKSEKSKEESEEAKVLDSAYAWDKPTEPDTQEAGSTIQEDHIDPTDSDAGLDTAGVTEESGTEVLDADEINVHEDDSAQPSLLDRIKMAVGPEGGDVGLESSSSQALDMNMPAALKTELDAAVDAAKVSGKEQAKTMAETIYSTAKTQQHINFALADESQGYRDANFTAALDMSENAEKAASLLANAYLAKSESEQLAIRDWVVSHASQNI
jgi:hypothetical protein